MLDRIDALLFAAPAAYFTILAFGTTARGPAGTLSGMTRVALLGATGSIGRQAIEVIDANPELELVAATSGSTPIDGLAPLTQVGRRPDRAARAGRARTSSSTRRRLRGPAGDDVGARARRDARAREQGEPRRRRRARARRAGAGRRRADPGRQRALGALPVRAARRAGERRPDGERRPVPRPHARRARRRHARARRSRTRRGRWARRSRSTRRRSRTRASR